MDFSRVAERFLKSVRSAGPFRILSPSPFNRPEVPARAAVVARALAKLLPHQKNVFSTNSENLISIYNSSLHEQSTTEELEENFYEKDFDPVRYVLEHILPKGNDLSYFEEKAELRITQLDKIAEKLSCHVMEHHEEMVKGMQLVMELEQDLKVANVICRVLINGLQHFISIDVKPKMQVIETFIKAYYLPESEYVYWAHSHPEYSKGQIIGLVNLVSTMKSWKRKTRLEVLEKIDTGT